MKPETELVRRSQQGDALAFEELVRSCQQKVFGLIYQILRSPEEVEDVAQEVFTKLYFSLPQFRLDSSFQAWLYRIVVNQCYDQLRKRKRSPQINYSDLSQTEAMDFERLRSLTGSKPPDVGRTVELRQIAERLLSLLPPGDRLLLVLKEVEDFSIEDLSGTFKISRNAVKLRLFRARHKLRRAFEKWK
jgi:RNA polymerase sigma-70 factor (ECF subfamily)